MPGGATGDDLPHVERVADSPPDRRRRGFRPAGPADAAELKVLQRCCWVYEAIANATVEIPALHETQTTSGMGEEWRHVVVRQGRRLVGAVRRRVGETGRSAG